MREQRPPVALCPVKVANEEDWLELLVASERIATWLDTIKTGLVQKKRQALKELAKEVQAKEAYAEEATRAGAIDVLTKLMSKTDDETLIGTAAAIIATCSGPLAGANTVQEVRCGEHSIWIREGALGDGLGARIWVAAHSLCRELVAHPELVQGKDILELGSGCGLCGLLAAKLGAKQVTLTDYERKVLLNLHACALGNSKTSSASASEQQRGGTGANSVLQALDIVASREGNAVTNVDHNDSKLEGASWDMGNVLVRFLDWSEALDPRDAQKLRREDSVIGRPREPDEPPGLTPGQRFPVIIGSDLLYEIYHADLVAAVVADRLASNGAAYIALAVRRQAHLDRLVELLANRGLTTRVRQDTINAANVGIVGREHEYEGGFVLVTIQHHTVEQHKLKQDTQY